MGLVEGFLKGIQAADIEREEAVKAKKQQIINEEIAKAMQPKGAVTGNTFTEVASGSIHPDNPQYPTSVKLENFKKKVKDVESSGGKYDAKNEGSGAYGAYQFIPSTAKWVAKELGIPYKEWKKPENQDKMFKWYTEHNKKGLEKAGIPVTEETLWWAHNQGLEGAKKLYRGQKLKKKNIQSNGAQTEEGYKKKWRKKFSDAVVDTVAKPDDDPATINSWFDENGYYKG